ncbi:MAG: hypothetical protein CML67_02115 [Rhodobacteraceae bacterium]|nr:hypothetical protein [Paracoccaceae bacterium]
MSTLIDKTTIVNWALSETGSFATFTIDGDDDLSAQVNLCWQRCVDHTFGLFDWKFLKKTFALVRTDATPINGWSHEFALPGGRIGDPLKITCDPTHRAPLRQFDIEGDFLYADEKAIYATFRVYRDPEHWDPAFRAAFAVALAAYLAVPISHDGKLRDELMGRAFGTPSREGTGGMFGRLMAQNKAAAPVGHPLAAADPISGAGGRTSPWHGSY